MSDIHNVCILFFVFGIALLAYGIVLKRSGNIDLLPYRVQPTVSTEADVKRIGLITLRIGLIIALVSAVLWLFTR